MATSVTEEDVQKAQRAVESFSERIRSQSKRIEELSDAIREARNWIPYYRSLDEIRKVVQGQSIWRPGALVILPFVTAAFVLVAARLLLPTSFAIFTAVVALPVAVAVALNLFYLPADETIAQNRLRYESQLQRSIEEKRLAESDLVELKQKQQAAVVKAHEVEHQYRLVLLERSKQYQRQQLLRRDWRALRGIEFELFLRGVFEALDYTVETTKASGDQGVDLLVEKDGMRVAVQAKGYQGNVGNDAVQQTYAGACHYRCSGGIVITNSRFTTSAKELARSTCCVLIDEESMPAFVLGQLDPLKLLRGETFIPSGN